MKKKKYIQYEKGGIDITAEAVQLLRTSPLNVLIYYYIGSIPFILGLLYFLSDMSKSAFAHQRCLTTSLGLTILFLWMKYWQTLFTSYLKAQIINELPPKWSITRIIRTTIAQIIIQPYGLLLIPIAMILMFPFYSVYSFYQNVTIIGDGSSKKLKELIQKSWQQALLWPKQNHILIWLLSPWVLAMGMCVSFGTFWFVLSYTPELYQFKNILWFIMAINMMITITLPICPFGCVVAGNIALILIMIPWAMNSLLGIQNVFTITGWHGIFNTTFLISVYGISYLCLDPLIKAAYTLRCFYGDSQRSGKDIIKELNTDGEYEF